MILAWALSEPPWSSLTSWTEDFVMPQSWVIPQGTSADLSDWPTIRTLGLALLFFQVNSELTHVKLKRMNKARSNDNKENCTVGSVLGSWGTTNAFDDPKPDFSGILSKTEVSLSKFVHRSSVDVNEGGTGVAVVSTVVVEVAKCPNPEGWIQITHSFSSSSTTEQRATCGRFSSP